MGGLVGEGGGGGGSAMWERQLIGWQLSIMSALDIKKDTWPNDILERRSQTICVCLCHSTDVRYQIFSDFPKSNLSKVPEPAPAKLPRIPV